jgi:hypothetical protein
MDCCVYLLTLHSGGNYVGVTNNLPRRLYEHRWRGVADCLVVDAGLTRSKANALEMTLISQLKPSKNITAGGQGHAVNHRPEVCQVLADKARARYVKPGARQAASEARKKWLAKPGAMALSRLSAAQARTSIDPHIQAERLRAIASTGAAARWSKYRREDDGS